MEFLEWEFEERLCKGGLISLDWIIFGFLLFVYFFFFSRFYREC